MNFDVDSTRRILFFDTETTNKANFGAAGSDPSQPLPVQLGALMYYVPEGLPMTYENAKEIHRVNLIVDQPRDIHPKAEEVHGISKELAARTGVSLETAMFVFDDMASKADLLVAHNMKFDIRVIERTYVEAGHHQQLWPAVGDMPMFCTMHTTTPILKLPKPSGYAGNKWPSLEECMQNFFGETIEGAHDALVDVEACARVFFHVVELLTSGA